jgi:hypothetical protein
VIAWLAENSRILEDNIRRAAALPCCRRPMCTPWRNGGPSSSFCLTGGRSPITSGRAVSADAAEAIRLEPSGGMCMRWACRGGRFSHASWPGSATASTTKERASGADSTMALERVGRKNATWARASCSERARECDSPRSEPTKPERANKTRATPHGHTVDRRRGDASAG